MSIFKKKKFDTENLKKDEEQFILPIDNSQDGITPWEERNIKARHALTKDEVVGNRNGNRKNTADFSGSLFAKIAEQANTDDFIINSGDDNNKAQENFDNIPTKPLKTKSENDIVMTSYDDSITPDKTETVNGYEDIADTEIDKIPIYKSEEPEDIADIINSDSTKEEVISLLEKCKDFIYDESTEKGEEFKEPELHDYELESVDDILSSIKKKVKEDIEEESADDGQFSFLPSDGTEENSDDDFYLKSLNLLNHDEETPENVKTVRRFSESDEKATDDVKVPARKVPVKIKMFDRATTEPVMVAIKDNLDLGATRVLPDINKTEVSLNSTDIQMSLADSGIVKANEPSAEHDSHSLYKKSGGIKKELLDEFFEGQEAPLPKPEYGNIISDSKFRDLTKRTAVSNGKPFEDSQQTRSFSLSEATGEFAKAEVESVVEVPDEEHENDSENTRFSKIENLNAISANLNKSLRTLKIKIVPTAVITAVLLIVSFLFKTNPTVSLTTVSLLAVVCFINFDIIKHITTAFSLNHGIDTPVSLICILTVIHTVLCGFVFKTNYINLTGIASFSVCANIFGKIMTMNRVLGSIELINNTDEKQTFALIENRDSAAAIAKNFTDGDALIGAAKPAVNLKGFVARSFEAGPYEKTLSKISLYSLVAAVLLSAVSYAVSLPATDIITAFLLAVAVCYPPAALMTVNIPLNSSSKMLKNLGAAYSGFNGAQQIEECNAIAVNAVDLFPKDTVKLYKMYILSENRVDNTFKCAAAVAKAANSPLYNMLFEVAKGEHEKLPKAEDINYEDKMGISGWIKDKRVLIGNRLLMEGHGVKIPESNIDKKILKAGYFPVYVAFDSKPCLLLICSYSVDDEIGYNIRNVCNLGITVLVNSSDPNLTENMLTDYFGLYDGSINIISPNGFKSLQKETEFSEDVSSPAVLGKSLNSFLKTVSMCNNLNSASGLMTVIHIFTIVLGLVAVLYLIISGRFSELGSLKLFIYLIGTSLITCCSYLFKRLK